MSIKSFGYESNSSYGYSKRPKKFLNTAQESLDQLTVSQFFKDGDELLCEMTSSDIWVKLKITIMIETEECEGKIINFTIEIKVNRNKKMKYLHDII